MYVDKELCLSELQAITAAAASTNYIDMTKGGDAYKSLWLVLRVGTVFTDGSSNSTLTVALQTDTVSNFASPTELWSRTFTTAELETVGNKILAKVRVPAGLEQYLRTYYTPNNGDFSTGTLDAFLTEDVNFGF